MDFLISAGSIGPAIPANTLKDLWPEGSGAAEGTRTPDPIITNDVLYQLSYSGTSLGPLPRGAWRCGAVFSTGTGPYPVQISTFSMLRAALSHPASAGLVQVYDFGVGYCGFFGR